MHGAATAHRGLDHPHLYDLLLAVLTRGRERVFREQILDLAGVAAGDRMLDIGCGTGTTAIAAARRAEPGVVWGVDVSRAMLAAARRKAGARTLDKSLRFVAADAVELPFRDGMFDVATMVTVAHMLPPPDRRPALAEIARVLRPGGRLLIIDYGDARPGDFVARYHEHTAFDLGSLRGDLAAAGLVETSAAPLGWLSLHHLMATKAATTRQTATAA